MVKMLTGRAWFAGAILILGASAASGQGGARLGTWGFVNARYDTRSPASMYTGYGWRSVFAMAGVLHNPRTGYAELIGGVGGVVRTGAAEHWLVFATAGTRNGSFAQLFWLPTVRTASITTRANVKVTLPYGGRAARKLSVSPLAVTLPLGSRLSAGAAGEVAAAGGARTRLSAGLELRVRIPGAAVGVDALRDVTGHGAQGRLFFTSVF